MHILCIYRRTPVSADSVPAVSFMAGNRSYYSVLPLLRSKAVSKTTKIRMYKTVIRPEVLYGSEAWCLTANDEKNLRIWERKVLRKILCGLEEQNKWRSEAVIWRIGHSNGNKKRKIEMVGTCGEDEWGKGGKEVISEHSGRKECRKTKVKVDGRCEGGPEEDGVSQTGGYVHTEEMTGRWSWRRPIFQCRTMMNHLWSFSLCKLPSALGWIASSSFSSLSHHAAV